MLDESRCTMIPSTLTTSSCEPPFYFPVYIEIVLTFHTKVCHASHDWAGVSQRWYLPVPRPCDQHLWRTHLPSPPEDLHHRLHHLRLYFPPPTGGWRGGHFRCRRQRPRHDRRRHKHYDRRPRQPGHLDVCLHCALYRLRLGCEEDA